MSLHRKILAAAAPLALLAVSACTQPFEANVARFQALPVPQGQTFSIEPINMRNQGGLEFAQYAAQVSQRLATYGYRPAEGGKGQLIVKLDYGVDRGVQKTVSRPSAGFVGIGPWGYGGYGPYGRRYGYGAAFAYGWDPFWYDPWMDRQTDTYTVYTSYVDMVIEDVADGKHVFEGKAKARSLDDSLPHLVPNLIEAMFTNFPGQSGEEAKITIAPPKK